MKKFDTQEVRERFEALDFTLRTFSFYFYGSLLIIIITLVVWALTGTLSTASSFTAPFLTWCFTAVITYRSSVRIRREHKILSVLIANGGAANAKESEDLSDD